MEAEKQPPARWSSRVSLEHHGGGRIPAGGLMDHPGAAWGDPACVSQPCCMSPTRLSLTGVGGLNAFWGSPGCWRVSHPQGCCRASCPQGTEMGEKEFA